ncbi:hypothetical protein MHK_002311 [Candidatus Magnetomorum sp. HK-1]|nr:hypothetical protein MHK_002311 [Candidatus Magnetomorum sp. HK-1]
MKWLIGYGNLLLNKGALIDPEKYIHSHLPNNLFDILFQMHYLLKQYYPYPHYHNDNRQNYAIEEHLNHDILPVFTLEKTELDLTEDFFPQYLTPTKAPTPFGENNQTITFRLEAAEINFANMAIEPHSGKISITSKPDKNGNEIINIIASDGQLSYTQTFLLTVTPVNDPPEFLINSMIKHLVLLIVFHFQS